MANIIEITLKATDKTKGVLGKVGGALAGIGKAAIAGAAAGFAIAGTAALAFGIKAVMAGADAEEMMSKLNATFGDASEDMISNLDAFAAATGRSRYELRGASTDMGAVLKALGATDEQAASMSASMTMLSADLGAFNNLPTADVAHKIQTALTGEFESLKSLGVVINQAKLNQELLNMGVEGGTAAATDYQKAMAIQNIIMAQTTDAQGAATREAGSFTGQMVALKAAMSDATTEIGMKLIPVLTPLITKFASFAAEVLPKVVEWVQMKLIPALVAFGAYIKETILPAISKFVGFLRDNWQPIVAALAVIILGVVVPAFIAWAGAAIATAAATIAAIAPIALPILAIAAVVALLVQAWKRDWGGIQTHLTNFWNNTMKPIGEKIASAFDKISGAIRGVVDWIRRVADKLKSIRLPSWLTGKSPSPFENTLHGISDALKEISGIRLPKFQAALDFGSPPMMAGTMAPGGGMGGGFGGNISMDNSRIVGLLREISEKPSIDEVKLSRLIRDAVLQVVD